MQWHNYNLIVRARSFTIGCMHEKRIPCTFARMFGRLMVKEVLYCHRDEISVEGPFGSCTAAKQKYPLFRSACKGT